MIDSLIFSLTCRHCKTTEKSRLVDRGSGWSGSSWDSSADFSNFETTWSGGGFITPELLSAKCKQCGSSDVEIESEFKV